MGVCNNYKTWRRDQHGNAQSHIVIGHSIERHILVSQNRGTAKSSILIEISIINQFLGFPIYGNLHV